MLSIKHYGEPCKILCKFCCFCQPPHLFQPPRLLTLQIFANLPVYYFAWNLPASPFIPPYPSIWNLRVTLYNKKVITPVRDVNNQKAFHLLEKYWQLWGSFWLEMKIRRKRTICFLEKKRNLKYSKTLVFNLDSPS